MNHLAPDNSILANNNLKNMKTLLLFIAAISLPGIILAQGIKIETNMIMTGGTTMYVDGNIQIDNGGKLQAESGSTIKLSNGKTLTG